MTVYELILPIKFYYPDIAFIVRQNKRSPIVMVQQIATYKKINSNNL
ncbi:MAG: hypothetical protein QNJ32_02965 [Xenococcaceae cyanobacterium MO_167.B27]|nr:hypothetical protein [Xenococcaceae cyanobacterium MO_167.B27]